MPSSRRAPISFAAAKASASQVAAVEDRVADRLPIVSIQPSPRNPRQRGDAIAELADSLREHGQLQPIVVRPVDAGYEVIAGHRRLEAAKLLGWSEIAAVVRDETDDQAYILTLVENLQREDLTPKEEAAALEVLVRARGWSTRQVGQAVKRSAMYVSRRLRVFDDPVLAPLVLRDQLAVSTAEELLREPTAATRRELAEQAVEERWERPQVRAVLAERNAALQPLSAHHRNRELIRLANQIRAVLSAGPVEDLSQAARSAAARIARDIATIGLETQTKRRKS